MLVPVENVVDDDNVDEDNVDDDNEDVFCSLASLV